MIILDLETSGLHTGRCGIWQIAIEFENPENYFIDECRIDDDDEITEEALKITGKTEADLRDKNKQSQKQCILNFLNWLEGCEERIIAGHNVGWDISFIENKCIEYGMLDGFREVMGLRSIDLHTLASLIYKKEKGHFKLENHRSSMNLKSVLEFCGLDDKRKQIRDGKITENGTPHNALEDAKLEAECFSRLLHNKPLLEEFEKFSVPNNLSENHPLM
jgi:DNA polymerase III epsilon subunit-like protein